MCIICKEEERRLVKLKFMHQLVVTHKASSFHEELLVAAGIHAYTASNTSGTGRVLTNRIIFWTTPSTTAHFRITRNRFFESNKTKLKRDKKELDSQELSQQQHVSKLLNENAELKKLRPLDVKLI